MANEFDYFSKDIIITGIHANECNEMWKLNDISNSYFKRLIDLYTIAPVIGLRAQRKSKSNIETDAKCTVFLQQVCTRREELLAIMRMVLLLDDSDGLSVEEKVNRAFKGPSCKEDFDHNVELFNSYALGGIEVLHDSLVKRGIQISDKYTNVRVANIMALLNEEFD